MKKIAGFLTFVLLMIANGCSSDHDHFRGYDYDDYAYQYYYHDGHYYYDADYQHVLEHDNHHFYHGRIEWKGSYWALVIRENPYFGLVCRIINDDRGDYHNRHLEKFIGCNNLYDREVMIKFDFVAEGYHSGYPLIDVIDMYCR
ncbi:MAG: hypothetical protein KBT22_02360 [Bacteroidales bacterium]|nr:hypothetical protein [Candidatus Scybalocola fimicaballi]